MKLGGLPIVGMESDSMEKPRTSPDYRYETASQKHVIRPQLWQQG